MRGYEAKYGKVKPNGWCLGYHWFRALATLWSSGLRAGCLLSAPTPTVSQTGHSISLKPIPPSSPHLRGPPDPLVPRPARAWASSCTLPLPTPSHPILPFHSPILVQPQPPSASWLPVLGILSNTHPRGSQKEILKIDLRGLPLRPEIRFARNTILSFI